MFHYDRDTARPTVTFGGVNALRSQPRLGQAGGEPPDIIKGLKLEAGGSGGDGPTFNWRDLEL